MKGKITGISGPTVSVDLKGLKLYERVSVGHSRLTGEVVRIEEGRTVLQVYEDTRGLAVGEPVTGFGAPLTVRLGPGILAEIFDGLQRPLGKLLERSGPFFRHTEEIPSLDPARTWEFHPVKKAGEEAGPGEIIGFVKEGAFEHYIMCGGDSGGRLSWISEGGITLDRAFAAFEDGTELKAFHEWPVRVPRPFRKKFSPGEPLVTGQRSIDFLFPLAKGGTAIMPGGFGTGKTILDQSIAKFADADVVIYAGCGERGNEIAELIEEFELLKDPWTKRKLLDRTILVVNTSNMPVAAREASIYTAVTIAEYYRDMGLNVLFLADSISRWAEALREISTSLEELPGEEGYPTYLASRLSGFFERAGVVETMSGKTGSLSMIISVSPPGGDLTEPVTQACLRTAGAFLMLDTSLAHKRHFPAINWFQSYSLYGKDLMKYYNKEISSEWMEIQLKCREILQKEESLREVAEIVGVEGLQDGDRLVMYTAENISSQFLCQNAYTEDAFSAPEDTMSKIKGLIDFYNVTNKKLKEGASLDEILEQA